MIINKKILVSDYDRTFYVNDEDIEKNKIAVNKFRKKGNVINKSKAIDILLK